MIRDAASVPALTIDDVLLHIKEQASTVRDQGSAFERLMIWWLQQDPVRRGQYQKVLSYRKWAESRGKTTQDAGIDLVAKDADSDTYTAIQCKFYDPEGSHRIARGDIDSFITASGSGDFARRLLIETTGKDWTKHAREAVNDQSKSTQRIGLHDLRQSAVRWQGAFDQKHQDSPSPKTLRPHQQQALDSVIQAFSQGTERGTLVMACGTGKTFTALRIAEALTQCTGSILVLTPSLALINQTIRSWHEDASGPLKSFAVCSDTSVGKKKLSDVLELATSELLIPATTDAQKIGERFHQIKDKQALKVVFATYHSIAVIAEAQKKYGLPAFNLVIADEAHRTTGCTFEGEEGSHFVQVHDAEFLQARHRLYMTATPRIYADSAKTTARDKDATLISMDDPTRYGQVLFHYSFASAIGDGLLSDYKIIILHLPQDTAISISDSYRQHPHLTLDDSAKIIGCFKFLNKIDFHHQNPHPLTKVLAFTSKIKYSKNLSKHFARVISEYRELPGIEEAVSSAPEVEVRHVDGEQSALVRDDVLRWLGEENEEAQKECRMVSNVRCLSEGVDVPALDGVIFFHPRQSQQEVVQAVGRVMRRSPDKDHGYIILPVVTHHEDRARETLDRNEPFRVIWQVVNALRSHDDRLDAEIHAASMENSPQHLSQILQIIGPQVHTVTELDAEPVKSAAFQLHIGKEMQDLESGASLNPEHVTASEDPSYTHSAHIIHTLITSTIVKHCSRLSYWPDWAEDVGKIAQATITRIEGLLKQDSQAQTTFHAFLHELQDDLNPAITQEDAIEMLAQHLVTKPIFEALFTGQGFAQKNPVSKAMDQIREVLHHNNLHSESQELQGFYNSVQARAQALKTSQGKQRLIKELYDKFFRRAFPRTTEKLGIAYTPPEIVDFILRSVDHILQQEFQSSLSHQGVHILDPFVGTGTFLTRLLQLKLIQPQDLHRKYTQELHANEIVLLAYYVAAVNIESAFYEHAQSQEYVPFPGICLTDTFAMDREDELNKLFKENSGRRTRQQNTDIRVIVGNPPYSAGQKNANDNAQNTEYENLDHRIRSTYAEKSSATNKNGLYDSYIRAIRWASDRIADSQQRSGIIGFITNASWLRALSADGLRQCLAQEFSSIYVFDLRGDARTSGEKRKIEGGNVFGSASRTPTAITFFVQNSEKKQSQAQIFYHNIGDFLSRSEKLQRIQKAGKISEVPLQSITPDIHGDWLEQRDQSFDRFIKMGAKKSVEPSLYEKRYSRGVITSRDAWATHHSKSTLRANIQRMLAVYHQELQRWQQAQKEGTTQTLDDFVTHDGTKIKWNRRLKSLFQKETHITFDPKNIVLCHYRPFEKRWLYLHRTLNDMIYQIPKIFPSSGQSNRVIAVIGKGCKRGFSAWMMDCVPNLHTVSEGQCFPLYWYPKQGQRRSALSQDALRTIQSCYKKGDAITHEDVFYYIYGLLHVPAYGERYGDNLKKELPRIPFVKGYRLFQQLSQGGRQLGDLHIHYERQPVFEGCRIEDSKTLASGASEQDRFRHYRAVKMRFGKDGNTGKGPQHHHLQQPYHGYRHSPRGL